jgi:capsule polysaccharide export protein KpsE/RkpR
LSTAEEQNESTTEGVMAPTEISMVELGVEIWSRRSWLTKVIGLGILVAIVIALLLPNKYTSSADLMPPDPQAISSVSVLDMLGGGGASMVPSLAGGLLSSRTTAGTFIGILDSRTAQDDIIDRFNLRHVYHCKFYFQARQALAASTAINEDKKSGIISIAVTDTDPNRARELTAAYIEELDMLVNKESTSSARRERIFLEGRIQSVKSALDTSSRELSNFSSRNATLDPERQGDATVEAAGKLQGELITAEGELSGLKAEYTDNNMRVREVQGQVNELQKQLQQMSGKGGDVDSPTLQSNQLLPSVRQLPILGYTYYNLYRQVTMQEAIYDTLNKQYELAKVEEAKDIPSIKVLDEPNVPERKSSPHRAVIVILGIFVSAFFGIVWILASTLWGMAQPFRSLKP